MHSQDIDQLTQRLLDAAAKAGAESADAMAVAGTSVTVDVRAGKLEQAERSEALDLGLRVLIGQKQAVVSSSDASEATLAMMAERAVAMAREAPDDPYTGLAEAAELSTIRTADGLELHDPTDEPAAETLQADALTAEATALRVDGVSQVQQATAAYGARRIHLAASNGFSGGYLRTDRGISCVAITGSGVEMERDYSGDARIFQSDLRSPEEIGQEAAERVLARRGARKPPTGSFPVLFDERIAASLIGHLLMAANGSSIARGSSWLLKALGDTVLPKGIDLIEDPLRPRASGSRPFDAEGLTTKRRAIVEDGVLQGWTLDLGNARKLGMTSTANAARSPGGGPSPATWNVSPDPRERHA